MSSGLLSYPMCAYTTPHSNLLPCLTSAEPYIMENGGTTSTHDSSQTVSFTCMADGVPTPAILWLQNGSLLQTGQSSRFSVSEETVQSGLRPDITERRRSVLTISDLSVRDSGRYSCKATNEIGTTAELRAPYQLIVNPGECVYCHPCRSFCLTLL